MITTAIAKQKEISQYIKMYQGIIEFSLDKMWLEVIIKHNKTDSDQMFDVINDKLIQVCEKYLETNNLWIDKFKLATIVMQLYTQAASECEEPYKVIVKETKWLLQDYLAKNKQKREALNRVKEEIEELEKEEELALKESELRKQNIETIKNSTVTTATLNDVEEDKKEEPEEEIVFPKKRWRKKKEVPEPEVIEPVEKPKKRRGIQSVYETAVEFTF